MKDTDQINKSNHLQSDTIFQSNTQMDLSDEISLKEVITKLRDWWKYLLSKWLIIVIAGIIGGGLGLIYSFRKKQMYIAELSFILEGQKPAATGFAGLASQFGLMGGGNSSAQSVFTGNNFFSLMHSRSMMQRLLLTSVIVGGKRITLAEYYIKVMKLHEQWKEESPALLQVKFPLNSDPSKFTIIQNSLISSFHAAILSDVLFIGPKNKKDPIMVIRVTSEDEMFSKVFAELVAHEVSEFYVSTNTSKTQRDLARLRHQADSVRREFNSAILGVSTSVDANPNPNQSRKSLAVPSKQRELDAQVNQAMLMELIKNIEMTKMTLSEETPLLQIIDSPVFPLPVSRPDRKLYIILGIIAFGTLAILYLIIRRVLTNL